MTEIVAVQDHAGEARADTRQLAARMQNKHRNVLGLIDDYADEFEAFGPLAFETEVRAGQQKSGGGMPSRYAMLNEEQCYFLLTLVRNSEATVPMKRELVRAFSEYRRAALAPAPVALPAAVGMDFLQQFAGNVLIAMQQQAATTKEEVKAEIRSEIAQQIGALPATGAERSEVRRLVRQVVSQRTRLGLKNNTYSAAYTELWDACAVGKMDQMTRDDAPRVLAYLNAQLVGLTTMTDSGLFGGDGQ